MSVPPQGGWQDPGVPPNSGQPHGQQFNPTGYGTQQPPPPGWQQGGWPQQPSPPPRKGNSLKWLLIAVAVLLIIGISVGATLIFTRSDGGVVTAPTSGAASDFASAGDTGPVAIITEEPTCSNFVGINNSLGDIQAKGWGAQRTSLGPASDWTPDQRDQVEAVTAATLKAAEQMEVLAKQTPHRLVRELYEQFVAFGRAYAGSIEKYTPSDNALASANISASSALVGICNTITFASAGRSVGVGSAQKPTDTASPAESSTPQRFISVGDAECNSWKLLSDRFNSDTDEWQQRDTGIPAVEWSPVQRSIEDAARPFLASFASDMATASLSSNNVVFSDFAAASALYLKAAVSAGNDYVPADGWLSYTSFRLNLLISRGCDAKP